MEWLEMIDTLNREKEGAKVNTSDAGDGAAERAYSHLFTQKNRVHR